MIKIHEFNRIKPTDDITLINAKLNGIGKSIKNVPVDDYCKLIENLLLVIPSKLQLEQKIIAKDFINIINVYDSEKDLTNNKCITVNKATLKVSRKL